MPWSVRTWRSSPECELARIAISAGSRSNASIPPASMSGERAEGLDRRAQGDDPVRVAEDADELAAGVGLDDVAAVDALLDAVAQLADEDRGRGAAADRRRGPSFDVDAAPRVRSRVGRSPWEGRALRTARIPRRAGAGASVRWASTPRRP